jgi:hypothetical protein
MPSFGTICGTLKIPEDYVEVVSFRLN